MWRRAHVLRSALNPTYQGRVYPLDGASTKRANIPYADIAEDA